MIIDFHSHILPGIDDGAKNAEMSLEMLAEMGKQGIDVVVATPHYYPWENSINEFLEKRTKAAETLWAEMKKTVQLQADGKMLLADGTALPKIILGAEVAYSFEMENLPDLKALCVQNTNTILVEMPFDNWGREEENCIESLVFGCGLNVVLAHYERFLEYQKSGANERILKMPVYVQVNAGPIIKGAEKGGLLGMFKQDPALKLFKDGTAHILGSDAHNMTSRRPNIRAGREILASKLGSEILTKMDTVSAKLCGL